MAATNQDLDEMVREGAFRKDLFFRLRVVHLKVPPLRERREDLLPLAREFIAGFCREYSFGPCSLSSEALDALMAYDWPGNVRELENAMERVVVLAEDKPCADLTDLPPEVRGAAGLAPLLPDRVLTLSEAERRQILAALDHFGGNRAAAAKALGIGETTLWRKLKSYGLVRPRQQEPPTPTSP